MEFSDITNHQISLLNSVLDHIGVPNLFENPNFSVDMDSLGYHYVKIKVISNNKKNVPLTFLLEGDGIRLDVYGIEEAFEWTNENIYTSRKDIVDFLVSLFTSYILIESCNSAYSKSRMYLFDKEGVFNNKYVLRGFIHKFSGWDCDKSLFLPIY